MSEQIRTFRQAAWYDDGDVVQEMEACENGTWVRWTDHVAAMHRRPPVDSVGVDRDALAGALSDLVDQLKWNPEPDTTRARAVLAKVEEEEQIKRWRNELRAALTAPADGCEKGCDPFEVVMGEGNVGVAPAYYEDSDNVAVSFMDNGMGEIGKLVEPETKGKKDIDCKVFARLVFTDKRAIDVVIRALEEAKTIGPEAAPTTEGDT